MAIQTFVDKATEELFVSGYLSKTVRWRAVSHIVKRKLDMLHYAGELRDLRLPPGNRLESLMGALKNHYSIRINDQWRIVFKWTELGPKEVRTMDYHK